MKNKNKPQCLFLAKGGYACDVSFPKPNQLCSACRPFWVQDGKRRGIAPVKKR